MNKGCIIAAVIVGLIVLVCAGVSIYLFSTMLNPMTIATFETGIKSYQEKHPDAKIPLESKPWVEAILAADSGVEANIANPIRQIAEAGGGDFVDIYQTPVKLQERADGSIQVLSAGKDKQFGTADDENTDKVKDFMDQARAK